METNYRRNRSHGMGWALLLICAGGLLLLFNLGVIPTLYKPILISWQMLLIALGVWHLIRKRYSSGLILTAIGAIFIYPQLYIAFPDYLANIDINFNTYWPGILIGVGLFLVFGKNKFRKHCKVVSSHRNRQNIGTSDFTSTNKTEYLEKNLMFSSSEQIVLSPNLKGGEGNVMFGELKIDLRKAILNEGTARLEINVMFGSAIIYVPSDWIVDIQNSSLFGGFRDNRPIQDTENATDAPHLIITGGCLFGSGEIRN